MDQCISCEEQTVKIPIGIFVPTRGTTTTDHDNDSPKGIVGFELPEDLLTATLLITLIGRNAAGTVRVSYQIRAMITRRQAETPNAYSVDVGDKSVMNAEDTDLEVELIEGGDTNATLRVTDTGGDAGVMNWSFSFWVLDQIKLA